MPKYNKHYKHDLECDIDYINNDISTLDYFLKQIPNCSVKELNNLNLILKNKHMAFRSIYNSKYYRNIQFNDVKFKILSDYPGEQIIKSYIKIGRRHFTTTADYVGNDSLLNFIVTLSAFHELSDDEQSKLILKFFTIEKDQYNVKHVLKQLKSQKAKDTLSKLLVLG